MNQRTDTTSPFTPTAYSMPPFPVAAMPPSDARLLTRAGSLFRRFSLAFWVAAIFTVVSMLLSIFGIGYASFFYENAEQAFSGGLSVALGFVSSMAVGIYLILDKFLAQIDAMERERQASVQRLRAVEESMLRGEGLSAVSAGIAHDFKNLFMPFTMGLDLMEGQALDPAARNLLVVMRKNLAQAYREIEDMLEFSHASNRKVTYLPTQLRELLDGYEEVMKSHLTGTISLQVVVAEGLPLIVANAEQILRALRHLVFNANEAIPAGVGRITIQIRRQEHKGVPSVAVSVADTGCGIKPDVLPQIFTPFFTTKSRGRGTGMGLSIVRGIVRGHRGSIDVQSEPGRGTTVTMFFPVQEPG